MKIYLYALLALVGIEISGDISDKAEAKAKAEVKEEVEEDEVNSAMTDPYEQFFLDRLYPDTTFNFKLYRKRLQQLIAYDKTHTSSRDLSTPWTLQGPGNIGGRVNAFAVHPANQDIMLLGYAQGGIYRTADNGQTWNPVFDDQASLSIADIQFDKSNPNIVWAATGDVNISGYHFLGAGIYKSEDAGLHWIYKGLDDTGILSKIAIDNNPQYIYVGSMGVPGQKGLQKGIYRSTNGGNTWQHTLTIDDSTGIIDIVADPTKSGRVFATSYTRVRNNTVGTTLGPGTAIYKSDDFGATWMNLQNGLPDTIHSRTSIEITNNGTLFVSYTGEHFKGNCIGEIESLKNIYTSTDAGASWDSIPTNLLNGLPCDLQGGFGWYFEGIKVNPENPLDIFALGVDLYRTLDGGFTWEEAAPTWWFGVVHADKHAMVFTQDEIFLGTDGGAYRMNIGPGEQWQDMENIPSTQYYRTTFNPHQPDQYYGGAQDNGTTGGNESIFDEWNHILGGDGFQPLFIPTEPDWMFGLTQYGEVWFSGNGGLDFDPFNQGLSGTRFWDMPFIRSPHDPYVLFGGSDRVFKLDMSLDIKEWTPISPDLTKQQTILSGRYPALTAIAQSALDSLRMYAGTQDGLVWTTGDGGMNWTNITDGTPGSFVTSIEASTIDTEGVFVTFSGYRENDHNPYIFQSDDAGLKWKALGDDLPLMAVNNIFIMPESEDTILIAGTDGGVYVSFDKGDQWDRVGTNMPYFPVYDVDYNPVQQTIIAATFARGIMTFPVEELQIETGTHDVVENSLAVNIYPTLVTHEIFVDVQDENLSGKNLVFSLLDQNGRVLESQNFAAGEKRVDLRNKYAGGIYFVRVQAGNRVRVQKVVITN